MTTRRGSTSDVLPDWFQTEGLVHLKAGEYEKAAAWYEAECQRTPNRAHGWLGLAAANLAQGSVPRASACLQNALELEPDFRVAPLLAVLPALDPQAALEMAEALYAVRSTPAIRSAVEVSDWCRAHPQGRRLAGRANALRERCLEAAHVRSLSVNGGGSVPRPPRRLLLLFLLFLVCAASAMYAYEQIEDAADGRPGHRRQKAAKPTSKPVKPAASARPR